MQEDFAFPDLLPTNIAFGGDDMMDAWVTPVDDGPSWRSAAGRGRDCGWLIVPDRLKLLPSPSGEGRRDAALHARGSRFAVGSRGEYGLALARNPPVTQPGTTLCASLAPPLKGRGSAPYSFTTILPVLPPAEQPR